MEMQVEDLNGGVAMVTLRGRLDMTGAGLIDLKFSIVAGSKRSIVVDMSAVEFLASLGIRVLVMGAKAVKNKGGRLVLLSPQDNVKLVLTTAGIDEIIPIMFDRADAIAEEDGVQEHADRGEEEQPEDIAQRDDVTERLVTIIRFAQHHARHEGAECKGKADPVRQVADAQPDGGNCQQEKLS